MNNSNRGEWFHPKHPGVRLPGMLNIEEGKIELTLYGSTDFIGNPIIDNDNQIDHYRILNGDSDWAKVTLVNSDFRHGDRIGSTLDTFTVSPRFVLFGAHFSTIEEIKLKKLGCTLSYLSAWMDGQEYYHFLDKNITVEQQKKKIYKRNTVKLKDDIIIDIERILLVDESSGRNTASSSVRHFVSFKSDQPLQLEQFEIIAHKFRKLISFAIDEQVDIRYDHGISTSSEEFIHIFQRRGKKFTDNGSSDYRNSSCMLFNAKALGDDTFSSIVANWFESYPRYGTIYDMFLDTQRNGNSGYLLTSVGFNNRLLNLIQCLESFHNIDHADEDESKVVFKQRFKEITSGLNSDEKKWLKKRTHKYSKTLDQRLEDLISEFAFLFEGILKNEKEIFDYAQRLSEIRNMFSHGRHKKTDTIEEYRDDYHLTRTLVIACILSKIGFNKIEIGKMINNSFDHSRELKFIKHKRS